MPIPTHLKFTARGVFSSTPEEWSFGFHFSRTVAASPDAGTGDVNVSAVTTAYSAFIGSSGAAISSNVKLMDWRCYVIGTDGRMEGNPLVVDVSAANITGSATNKYPPQIALCATLVADNRGPARFGRFFIPGPTSPLDNDMRISNNDVTNVGTAVSALLKSISSAIDLPGTIESSAAVNVSTRGGSAGTLQNVDHVEIGRVLDTLRTRRKSMLEERHVHAQIDW